MCILELQVVIGWSLAFREEANFSLFCFDEFIKAHIHTTMVPSFPNGVLTCKKLTSICTGATIMSLSILSPRYKSIELSTGHVK